MWKCCALFLLFVASFRSVSGHGAMLKPPQRGCTNGFKYWGIPIYDRWAKTDWYAHFPAGDKSTAEGAGHASQKKEAGPRGWVPYNPRKPAFRFRAGVCGDLKYKLQHLRGGKYYNKGRVSMTYEEDGNISIDIALTQHHNGFFEFRLCDVKYCGGEISEKCLRGPHCYLLQRAPHAPCDTGREWGCAPIDPDYPSRWYLPCPSGKIDYYGRGKILYKLPKGLTCKHCVLQWYWVAGNSCNPPGLEKFFMGPKRPQWKQCKGQGHARNGWRRWLGTCNGPQFPEEYYQCADVRIKEKPKKKSPKVQGFGGSSPIQKIIFYGNGIPRRNLFDKQTVTLDAKDFSGVTFRATTHYPVSQVVFYAAGSKYFTDTKAPYFLEGTSQKWKNPIFNRQFKLQVWAGGSMTTVFVTLKK